MSWDVGSEGGGFGNAGLSLFGDPALGKLTLGNLDELQRKGNGTIADKPQGWHIGDILDNLCGWAKILPSLPPSNTDNL